VAEAEATMRERLGEHIIGDEKLSHALVRRLREHGMTLALYEGSATAPVYRAIAAAPRGAELLSGVVLHPLDEPADDEAAQIVARTNAIGARDRWRTTLGLGVQPASAAGPDGFTAVAVAIADANGVHEEVRRFDLRSDEALEFIGTFALDALRQHLP
jgi:nicotinamide-nucleotide amidase